MNQLMKHSLGDEASEKGIMWMLVCILCTVMFIICLACIAGCALDHFSTSFDGLTVGGGTNAARYIPIP